MHRETMLVGLACVLAIVLFIVGGVYMSQGKKDAAVACLVIATFCSVYFVVVQAKWYSLRHSGKGA